VSVNFMILMPSMPVASLSMMSLFLAPDRAKPCALTVMTLNHLDLVFFALAATAVTPTGTPCTCHSPGSGPKAC